MDLDYIEIFFLSTIKILNDSFESKISKKYYYFFGGFLSRFIYDKPFKICASAGQLLVNKVFKAKTINYSNVDSYNIIVPNKKKIKILELKGFKQSEKLYLKENNFKLNDINNKSNNKNLFIKKDLNYMRKNDFKNKTTKAIIFKK